MNSFVEQESYSYTAPALMMLLSSAFVATGALVGKWLTLSIGLSLFLFFRFAFPCMILWWTAFVTRTAALNLTEFKYQFFRAICVVLCQYAFFICLSHSNLLNATILFMTSPLFVPLILKIFNRVTISKAQWASILIGFIGVLFILNPKADFFSWFSLIGLAAGILNAFSQVFYHKLSKASNPMSATLSLYSIATFVSLALLLINYQSIFHFFDNMTALNDSKYLLLFIGIAVVAISSQIFRGYAYRKSPRVDYLTPILYTSIVFAGLFDWWIYGITPSIASLIGALLIFASSLAPYFLSSK